MHIAKIKEFLFKIINKYLFVVNYSKRSFYCDSENHTFKHMVLECTHCTNLWNLINTNYNLTITYRMIIMGVHNNPRLNNLIFVITYLIYKKYLTRIMLIIVIILLYFNLLRRT